jgi:hypothetical protein
MQHSRRGWQRSEEMPLTVRGNLDQTVTLLPVSGIQSNRSSYEFEVKVKEAVCPVELIQKPFLVYPV